MRSLTRRFVVLLSLVASGCGLDQPTVACDCAMPFLSIEMPPRDASNVPINTRFWLGGTQFGGPEQGSAFVFQWTRGDVAATTTTLGNNMLSVVVVTPTAELQPMTRYTVLRDGNEVGRFTTGTARDDEPPAVPVPIAGTPVAQAGMCGDSVFAPFTFDPATGSTLLMVADVGDAAKVDAKNVSGPCLPFTSPEDRLGTGGCGGNWAGAAPGAATSVIWGAFDLAGNFSGWGKRSIVVLPELETTRCSSAAGAGVASLALVRILRRRQKSQP